MSTKEYHTESYLNTDHRDSGLSEPADVFGEFEERKDNLLDHLVPAQDRSWRATNMPIRAHISDESSLRSMQIACKAAEESYSSRKQWSPEVLNGFNSAFATLIKVPACHVLRAAVSSLQNSCVSPHDST